MGFIKQMKQDMLAEDARRAVEQGRTIFAPRLNIPASQNTISGPVAGWAEMLEGIESQGWRLDHWAVAIDEKGRPEAYPLFRRV